MTDTRTISKALELTQSVYFDICDMIEDGAPPRIKAALELQKQALLEIEARLEGALEEQRDNV